jgi:DNA-binding NtrC family response regulator
MDRPRVLVVEDRPSVLKLMATILESGYEITTASSGTAALSLVASAHFDVVLTDVRMPGASGFDVLRAVKDRAPRTTVVMITAYAGVADAVAAIRLGAYDYVAKPLDASEIALVIARAVEHLRDAVEACEPSERQGFTPPDGAEDIAVGFHRAVEEARRRASHDYLVHLMRLFHGNVTQAATRAGMTRESLHRLLRQYDIRSEHYKIQVGDVMAPRRAVPPPATPRDAGRTVSLAVTPRRW